ncbi:hypothetical protein AAAV73_11605 [Hominicoprocola fusiformis]|jgi:hypothetical protein
MNTPKLAIAMNYIDENLISGAIDYKPTIPSKKVTLFKKHIVAVAACLCVIVMAVTFTLQNDVRSPVDDIPPNSNDNIIDNTPTIADPIDNVVWNDVSSIPGMMLPFLGEENCVAMSSKELFEYYGIDIASQLSDTGFVNEVKGAYPHGIYTYSNGDVFDMNSFVFASEDGMQEIECYIGKTTDCEKYASNLNVNEYERSQVNGIDVFICQYKDSTETCLFSILNINGCDVIMMSNNIDKQMFLSALKSLTGN